MADPTAGGGAGAGPASGARALGDVDPATDGPEPALARVAAALLIAGLVFRAPILIVGPLVPMIRADLGISHGVAGLLTSIPVLCMAVLAPLGPVLAASIGPRLAVGLCIATVGGFGVLRAMVPGAALVILLTVGVGIGMGVVGPVLPMVVRRAARRHPALGTGAYVVGYIVGGTVAAATVVPLASILGGWRPAFGVVGGATFLALAGWWLLSPRDHGHVRAGPSRPRLPWRNPVAWNLGVAFGLQSTLFYSSISWLASIYGERGWKAADAAGLSAYFAGLGLISTLAVPLFGDRIGTRRQQLLAAAMLTVIGATGIALGAGSAAGLGAGGAAVDPLALPAITLFGLGIGLFFPLLLTVPVDVAPSSTTASALAAFMLLVGYLIASVAPVVLGAVRDATGSFTIAAWMLVLIALLMLGTAWGLDERRIRARIGSASGAS